MLLDYDTVTFVIWDYEHLLAGPSHTSLQTPLSSILSTLVFFKLLPKAFTAGLIHSSGCNYQECADDTCTI